MGKILLTLFLFSTILLAGEQPEKKHILVLHSYHKTMSWVTNIDKAIQDTLKPYENNYVLYTEYMDTKRIFNAKYLEDLKGVYKLKYKDVKLDLILSSDNNAFDFLRKNKEELFGDVAVSFCGVNNFKQSDLDGYSNYTGVAETIDSKTTVEIAFKLYPKAKKVFIINDYLVTGKAWTKTIKEQLKDLDKEIIFSKDSSIEELQATLQNLKDDTIVLLGVYFKDKNGVYFTYEKIGELIANSASVPVFCLLEFNLRKGVVGGSVIGGYYQGLAQSKIGKQILDGIPADNIPVQLEGSTKLIFDYNAMQRHNIDMLNVPSNATVLNEPISFFKKHQTVILISSIVIMILLIVIVMLLINIKRRKETEKLLKESELEITKINQDLEEKVLQRTQELESQKKGFETLFENSSDGLLILKDNHFVQCNQKVVEMLGYVSKKDVLNTHPSKLSPEFQHDGRSSLEKADDMIQISLEKKGYRFEWIHTKANGENFWVEVSLTPMVLNNEDVIYVIWRDISDKKKNEEIILQQTKMAALGEMIGNIAHQWRQPLSVITAGASGIKIEKEMGQLTDESLFKNCDAINDNAQYLSKTIDDFRNFIKGDREKINFNLNNSIERLLHLIEGTIKSNQIQVVENLEGQINLEGYPNELTQCLINIFNNSKDALSLKENERYFFIDTKIENDKVVIICKDNAGGIPVSVLPHIFEPYFTTKHQSKGTGLGLSMTYNIIVEGMKGSVSASNVEFTYNENSYSGAEVKITLPLK